MSDRKTLKDILAYLYTSQEKEAKAMMESSDKEREEKREKKKKEPYKLTLYKKEF